MLPKPECAYVTRVRARLAPRLTSHMLVGLHKGSITLIPAHLMHKHGMSTKRRMIYPKYLKPETNVRGKTTQINLLGTNV